MSNLHYFTQYDYQLPQYQSNDQDYTHLNHRSSNTEDEYINVYKIQQIPCQILSQNQDNEIDFLNPYFSQEKNHHFHKFEEFENNQIEYSVDQLLCSFIQPTYNGDINEFSQLPQQLSNYNFQESLQSNNIDFDTQDIHIQPQINFNTSNLNNNSISHDAISQAQDKISQTTEENQDNPSQTDPKIKRNNKIHKHKKYNQDQTYKGICQRLCILCKDKPQNKSYKKHLIELIAKAIINKQSTENSIILKIAKKYDKSNENNFISHLLELLKSCQHKLDIQNPSVIRAVKGVYNSVTIGLANLERAYKNQQLN